MGPAMYEVLREIHILQIGPKGSATNGSLPQHSVLGSNLQRNFQIHGSIIAEPSATTTSTTTTTTCTSKKDKADVPLQVGGAGNKSKAKAAVEGEADVSASALTPEAPPAPEAPEVRADNPYDPGAWVFHLTLPHPGLRGWHIQK